jgi:imidazolonepropionase-like amidohydrolase
MMYVVALIGYVRICSPWAFVASDSINTSAHRPASAASPELVFTGVTVIDVATGARHANQTVVIAGTRIQAVGAGKSVVIPAGAHVVDARGKYLIPGLWDMHAHVDQYADFLYPGYIAAGVTGLREMAQRFPFGADSFRVWQHEVASGTRIGPRVLGPSFDVCYWHGRKGRSAMPTPADARRIVDSLKQTGIVFLKQHGCSSRDNFFTIAAEARRVGMPVVGHISNGVSEIEASDSGMRSIEHVQTFGTCWPGWPRPLDTLVEQRCTAVAAAFIRNQTWMVPTLYTSAHFFGDLQDSQDFVRMMHRRGVSMLAGTDWTRWTLDEGTSLHEELALLVGAGLTPLEALQAATLNPARFMHGTDSLGTIARGKLADLVLLDADPLVDIHNTTEIRAVVANGRYFDAPALATLRASSSPAELRRRYAGADTLSWQDWMMQEMYDASLEDARDGDIGYETPLYLGYRRAAGFMSPEPLRHDTVSSYTAPPQLRVPRTWGLGGTWRTTSEAVTLPVAPGRLKVRFHSRYFNLLFGPARDSGRDSVRFRVLLDGEPPATEHTTKVSPSGKGMVRRAWFSPLAHQRGPLRDRTIEIEFLDPVTLYEVSSDPIRHHERPHDDWK